MQAPSHLSSHAAVKLAGAGSSQRKYWICIYPDLKCLEQVPIRPCVSLMSNDVRTYIRDASVATQLGIPSLVLSLLLCTALDPYTQSTSALDDC